VFSGSTRSAHIYSCRRVLLLLCCDVSAIFFSVIYFGDWRKQHPGTRKYLSALNRGLNKRATSGRVGITSSRPGNVKSSVKVVLPVFTVTDYYLYHYPDLSLILFNLVFFWLFILLLFGETKFICQTTRCTFKRVWKYFGK